MTRSQPLAWQNAIRIAEPLDNLPFGVTAALVGMNAFMSRLSGLAKLSAGELLLLQGLSRFTRSHVPREEIGNEAKPMMARVMISGWACRQRVSSMGRHQIINLILPGDVIGNLECPELPSEDSFAALTPVITADASALVKAVGSGDPAYRGLAHAVRLLGFHATAMIRDQIVRLGRQTAHERLMHLMLELHARFQVAGMATSHAFPLPVSQEVLGAVVARGVAHVNRSMQQARRDGLLETQSGQVKILDLEAMQVVADWTPKQTKLSISPPPGQLYARSA